MSLLIHIPLYRVKAGEIPYARYYEDFTSMAACEAFILSHKATLADSPIVIEKWSHNLNIWQRKK